MRKGFTLIELAVAVGLLVVVLLIASTIFRVSIDSQRIAMANTEVMQKLRAITDQLNADFEGLRKDGEIFVAWVAHPAGLNDPEDPDDYVRMDRIMFFTEGDFQSYGHNGPIVRGNFARVCYLLARDENNDKPEAQPRAARTLARTQHIMAADAALTDAPSLAGVATWTAADQNWFMWNNLKEYDKIPLNAWKMIDPAVKMSMLSVITDITAGGSGVSDTVKVARVDPKNPGLIHLLLAEGVGEFTIQGWNDSQQRWVPMVDPDGDMNLADSDFFLDGGNPPKPDPTNVPGAWYSTPMFGAVVLNGSLANYPQSLINEAGFNNIPGLGRALKFTFTIYDSKGVLKSGRTFTHIVHLDN